LELQHFELTIAADLFNYYLFSKVIAISIKIFFLITADTIIITFAYKKLTAVTISFTGTENLF